MRATNRKINKQPVRSPSPDIAAKNKITTTNAPMAEVMKKSRINSLASMCHDLSLEELQKTIIDWEQKYKILQRQLNSLILENSGLKKEIVQLKNLLAQNKPIFTQPVQDISTLRDYESRFARMMEQIRRIQELLSREKEKSQFLQIENQKIKSFADSRRDNSEQLHKNFNYIEQTLNVSFERMKAEHELKARLTFNNLAERMSKIERNLFSIENSIAKSEFKTPKIVKEGKFDQFSTTPGNRSPSPSESKKFSRKSIPREDERDQTLELMSQENNRLRQALESEKNKKTDERECITCPILERRIAELQMGAEALKREKELADESGLANELDLQRERETFRLQDYLRRIREVKTILNNQQFRQFVFRVNQLINDNTKMHLTIEKLQEEKEIALTESKRKEIQSEMIISELKRENQICKGKIMAQDEQLGKLQKLIQQKMRRSGKYEPEGQKSQADPKIFQRYIEEAIRKLESLQQSIQSTLQE